MNDLATKTPSFADAFAAGDDGEACSLYADARMLCERIEPVAESFGDLDPSLDLREADLGPQRATLGDGGAFVGQTFFGQLETRGWA